MYRIFFKRLFDIIFSFIGLVILSPIFMVIFILLSINNQGKPFFFQRRPGKGERIFKVIKFKTMTDKKDKNGKLFSDIHRLTKLGNFIRKISFDEIPQLINVLKGDMSLIGPRPLMIEYLPLYTKEQQKRHQVRPGITGWAQINGRNTISWQKKFEYDVWYVENLNISLDIKIFFRTFMKVLKSEGVNASDITIMEKFNGKN